MTRSLWWSLSLACLIPASVSAQSKKPLDHTVYDGWQNIGVKTISNNGQWAAYTVTPQEGDATLVVRNLRDGRQVSIPRGSAPVITEDSRYVVFYIKPFFQDTRQARIKKKIPTDMPKDSLGILELGQTAVTKIPNVRSFKTPEKGSGLLAYLMERPKDTAAKINLTKPAPLKDLDADDDTPGRSSAADAGDLVIVYLGKQHPADTVKYVTSYTLSKPGNSLALVTNPPKKDSLAKPAVLLWDAAARRSSILSNGHGAFAQFAFDEAGKQLAYVGSRDSAKALQKFYSLYYFKPGQDTARIVVTKSTKGIPANWDVSEDGRLVFSRNGERLFFGTAPIPKPKDTTIVDFEVAKVDIWHYQDDYLQTMQLKNLDRELKRNYAAVYFPAQQRVVQLADLSMETFFPGDEGNANYGVGYTDANSRVAMQWTGGTLKTGYAVNISTGERKVIKTDVDGNFVISSEGRFILWFDQPEGQWHTYETATGTSRVISANIPARITDEEMDMPDYPRAYGTNGWQEHDKYVYINDRYDIWQVDPLGKETPVNLTKGEGRRLRTSFRILKLDQDERFILPKQHLLLAAQNDSSKYGGLWSLKLQDKKGPQQLVMAPYAYSAVDKAKNAEMYLFQRSSFVESPDVFAGADIAKAERISALNPQQRQYNWGTAELFSWQTYNGKTTEGILYKPEDFDPNKKYPVLIYFYEKLTDGLYSYQAPAPTPSRLNITFFVSRGYVVLAPDIRYETGHPGKSAYNYIVSGAEALAKNPWIDKTNMGIQGQSWGGYQVCYLITATPLFKAAWAGAPVANMTSAYGGIRWESGMNRQFQYEHSQSRIGATLWDKPELYIENSPLFHIPKVTTPLAIMHNDADGAVPWYQGIEMFTAMRRLGKPVWLLNYNGEAHNLVQRQNRKDIQVREQQFFDHFLKGAPAPKWLSKGVPATEKGKDWGFDY
ncbi:alpha/beta hydrolase family protein [Chitinophaga sp. GCM10012297]|uniref:S9 family peptidase n=1 Tax=Chitinophaga chungangae TaxID=2821488 RepID=A0ABS3YKQ8_9BACT|nr:prolyl oligopeptidase family serine peptidase [Chitinophaga chungangae]MBO9155285.1 S9 family peptidase [Chitinophaga chungangae]